MSCNATGIPKLDSQGVVFLTLLISFDDKTVGCHVSESIVKDPSLIKIVIFSTLLIFAAVMSVKSYVCTEKTVILKKKDFSPSSYLLLDYPQPRMTALAVYDGVCDGVCQRSRWRMPAFATAYDGV